MGIKKKLSFFLIIAVVAVAIAIIIYFSGIFVPSAIHSGTFTTEVVTNGEVVSTIQAPVLLNQKMKCCFKSGSRYY